MTSAPRPARDLRDPPKTWIGSLWRYHRREALGLLVVAAGLAGWLVIRQETRKAPRVVRPAATLQIDISHAPAPQRGPAAVATRAGLLAASDDGSGRIRVYRSNARGERWRSQLLPSAPGTRCEQDPAVADGYVAFVAAPSCPSPYGGLPIAGALALARARQGGWSLAPTPARGVAELPALALDSRAGSPHRGRLYLSWVRGSGDDSRALLVAWSDDAGRSWSAPVTLAPMFRSPSTSSLAVGVGGRLYVTFADDDYSGVWIASVAGRRVEGPVRVALYASTRFIICVDRGKASIVAQPLRCVGPTPTVSVDRAGGVHVVYGADEANGSQGVFAAAFDSRLRWLVQDPKTNGGVRVPPPDPLGRKSDQFLPASALDPEGRLWACWYDTAGDPSDRSAWYTCAFSANGGRRWSRPFRAASVASNEFDRSQAGYGDRTAVVVAGGSAHPFWTDTRDRARLREEIFGTRLTADKVGR